MRTNLLTRWAAALAAVGMIAALPPSRAAAWGWFGADEPANPMAPPAASYNRPPVGQQSSWTTRVTAPLSPSWWTSDSATKPSYENDPIAVNNLAGPPTPAMYVAMAGLADRGGNSEEARRLYQRAIAMDARSVDAHLALARFEDRQGRLPEATLAYRRAAELAPNNATALNDFALCLARQGNYGESYRLLQSAINMQPKKPLYRNNMAKVLIEMNRLDEALANLNTVAAPAVAHYNMGALLVQRGRTVEAKRYLATALTMEPRMAPARQLMAQLSPSSMGTSPAPHSIASSRPTPVTPPAFVAQSNQRHDAPQGLVQTARAPQVYYVPQQAWSPPAESSIDATSAPTVDDSILPTPEETTSLGAGGQSPSASPQSRPTVDMPRTAPPATPGEGPTLLPAVSN